MCRPDDPAPPRSGEAEDDGKGGTGTGPQELPHYAVPARIPANLLRSQGRGLSRRDGQPGPARWGNRFSPRDPLRGMAARTRRARVTGIGGIFFKARDPEALARWYREHLGIAIEGMVALFAWRSGKDGKRVGHTVWSIFPADTSFANPASRRIPVTTVERIIPALDGIKACGSAPARLSPRIGLIARGTARRARRAHGVRENRTTPRTRIAYAARTIAPNAVVARATPSRTTSVRFPTAASAGMSGISLIHRMPATSRARCVLKFSTPRNRTRPPPANGLRWRTCRSFPLR